MKILILILMFTSLGKPVKQAQIVSSPEDAAMQILSTARERQGTEIPQVSGTLYIVDLETMQINQILIPEIEFKYPKQNNDDIKKQKEIIDAEIKRLQNEKEKLK